MIKLTIDKNNKNMVTNLNVYLHWNVYLSWNSELNKQRYHQHIGGKLKPLKIKTGLSIAFHENP